MKKRLSSFAFLGAAVALAVVGRAAGGGSMGGVDRGAFAYSPGNVATKSLDAGDTIGNGYSISNGVLHILNTYGWTQLSDLSSSQFANVSSIELDADTIVVSESLAINLNLPLDGKGHMVAFEKQGYQVFDSIGVTGSVKNLRIEPISKWNVSVQPSTRNVGGIVAGVNRGKITDCYIRGSLDVDIKGACYGLDTDTRRVAMGGIVGENYGEISRCHVNTDMYMVSQSSSATDGYTYPAEVFVSCMVGYNAGSIKDCFFNAAYAGGNTMRGNVFSGSSSVFRVSFSDSTITENPRCAYALCVAEDAGGTVSGVYCTHGTFDALTTDNGASYEGCPTVVVANGNSGTQFYSAEVSDDKQNMQELESAIPSFRDLQFADNSAWGFDYMFYSIDTASYEIINYRSPVPLMGAEPSFGGLAVAGGAVTVDSKDQWNHLSDALDRGEVKTVTLEADLSGSDNSPLRTVRNFYDVVLEGNAHTVSFETVSSLSLFDVIGEGSTVRNLSVDGDARFILAQCYGLLAKENRGVIESVRVGGLVASSLVGTFDNLDLDYQDRLVYLGAIVGVNYGTVRNVYSNVSSVFLQYDHSGSGAVCPAGVTVGGLVGFNDGDMSNCVIDLVLDSAAYENGLAGADLMGCVIGSSATDTAVYIVDTTSVGTSVYAYFGYAVGENYGTMSNIYCSKGAYSDSYRSLVSLNSFIVNEENVSPVNWADDASVMTEIGRKWPIGADLKALFGDDAAKWTFNISDYERAQNPGYSRRSPIPTMGRSVEFDYAKLLDIVDGVSMVRDSAQWDATCCAIADGVDIDGVEIVRDFAMSDNQQTIVSLDVTLNGGKHKISGVSRPLVETIGETGAVRNLSISGNYITVGLPTFGTLACVNAGSVDGVLANVSLKVSLSDALNASLEAEDTASVGKVAIGGLVGRNSGAITSTHVSAAIESVEGEDSEIKLSYDAMISSFHVASVAGYNSGTVKDCYVGNVVGGQQRSAPIWLNGTVYATLLDGAENADGEFYVSCLTGNSDHTPTTVLCAPGMAESGQEGGNLSFTTIVSNTVTPHSVLWNDDCTSAMTELEVNDSISSWWGVDANLYLFDDPTKWTFNVGSAYSEETGDFRYPVPSMIERIVDVETDKETNKILVAVSDSSSLKGFFEVVGDAKTGFYRDAVITFLSDVAYSPFYPYLDTLTAGNVGEVLDSLPSIPRFNGVLNGSNVDNLAFQTGGVIDTLDADGSVNNLVLNKTLFYVDPTNPGYLRSNDTVYVHLLVGLNNGRMNNVGVSGCVVVDDRNLSALGDTAIVIVLVGEDSGLGMSGYIFLDDPQTPGTNKRFIPVKQNLATGRNKVRVQNKVAMRNSGANKSLGFNVDLNSPRFKQGQCLFTDEEFGNGLVAYWLNHSGEGFTGDYTGSWTQGDRVPVSAKNKRTALYRVEVEQQGDSALTSAPMFANGGSVITLRHSQRPLSITMGEDVVPVQSDTLTTLTYVGGSKIVLKFGPTSLVQVEASPFGVTVDGRVVRFAGGEGATKTLYDLAGVKVAETTADEVRLSQKGIFIARCGKWTHKLTVK